MTDSTKPETDNEPKSDALMDELPPKPLAWPAPPPRRYFPGVRHKGRRVRIAGGKHRRR